MTPEPTAAPTRPTREQVREAIAARFDSVDSITDAVMALLAGEGTAQPDPSRGAAQALIAAWDAHQEALMLCDQSGAVADTLLARETALETLRAALASGEGTAPQPAGLVQCGWLQTYDDPDAPPGPLYAMDSDPDGHAEDVADERLVPVYRLAERGTALQVPAERVLWEGEWGYVEVACRTEIDWAALKLPLGSHVRVVAADGAPQPDHHRSMPQSPETVAGNMEDEGNV